MPITTVDVDLIISDEDFDEWLGGHVRSGPMQLQPSTWQDSKPARQYALDRVLEALRRRTPPIEYGQLQFPQELSLAVRYGAAEHLYQIAMSTGVESDIYMQQRMLWEMKFNNEISGLTPTLEGGVRGAAGGFAVSRR